jgi:F-type H+-transporting ATPase subunit h
MRIEPWRFPLGPLQRQVILASQFPLSDSSKPADTSLKADLVQDLYLKELKAYKAPAIKATDSEGHVQNFSAPKAPKSPEEADIASELKAYEASTVDIEGQAEGGAVTSNEFEWFEEEPEEEARH